jgi:hypothetical protein
LIRYDYTSNIKGMNWSRVVLVCLLLIQIIDLKPLRDVARSHLEYGLQRPEWNQDLQNPIWYNLSKYKHLYILMNLFGSANGYPAYFKFGMVASLNKLSINAMYLARGSSEINKKLDNEVKEFMQGNLVADSVYVVDVAILGQMNPQILNTIDCNNVDNYILCTKK